jgi:hypothetical protein
MKTHAKGMGYVQFTQIEAHGTDACSPFARHSIIIGNPGYAAVLGRFPVCWMPVKTESGAGAGKKTGSGNRSGAAGGFCRQEWNHDHNRGATAGGWAKERSYYNHRNPSLSRSAYSST